MTFWNFFFLILIYVPLVMLWVFTLVDLAHRQDLSGVAKGLWAVAVVLLPIVGMLVYFITRPDDVETPMATGVRSGGEARVELTLNQLDEIEKLAELRDSGALTDDEFAMMKAKILG
ncbi:MAG: SHOCT domain-containing protein [Actinomycetia bacterium]|nr:SHOCT domain-containing protein [Actinomycetes bacterium]